MYTMQWIGPRENRVLPVTFVIERRSLLHRAEQTITAQHYNGDLRYSLTSDGLNKHVCVVQKYDSALDVVETDNSDGSNY